MSEGSYSGTNIQEEKELLTEDNLNFITVENADFSNQKNMINSPRSLQACKELGILPKELYKISIEEFKSQNPTLFNLEEKLLQFRFEGYEKFRNESIELVRKKREEIINKENDEDYTPSITKNGNYFFIRSIKKMKEDEKKMIEKFKKRQKNNLRNIIEQQINRELLIKSEKKKEWKQQKREEELMKIKKENEIVKKKEEEELNERKKRIEEEIKKKRRYI